MPLLNRWRDLLTEALLSGHWSGTRSRLLSTDRMKCAVSGREALEKFLYRQSFLHRGPLAINGLVLSCAKQFLPIDIAARSDIVLCLKRSAGLITVHFV